jgi:hypothetical protein
MPKIMPKRAKGRIAICKNAEEGRVESVHSGFSINRRHRLRFGNVVESSSGGLGYWSGSGGSLVRQPMR